MRRIGKPSPVHAAAESKLRDLALAYPETTESFPWDHRAIKVKGKTFLFLHADASGLGLSVKLPVSRKDALKHAFASPTAYGLGKSGWVSASFAPKEKPPVDVLARWLDESYRAIAPKRLVKGLK
ncbi:MAG TPA: MmcQ/YjbR family DNA-binding protein [Planctomycetota bacterium]|nr:MmcQ/YjbR family DNA-binding protein [Planctomycetota bacterium]